MSACVELDRIFRIDTIYDTLMAANLVTSAE